MPAEETVPGSVSMSPGDIAEAAPRVAKVITSGTQIGRYMVVGLLGAGGMGEVYRARDPRLERDVAIKVLRPELFAGSGARLLREAQAMAKLSHANVVAVYEAVELDDQIFVVMELVEGESLRAWLAEKPRSQREIMEVFLGAGRGLAAAHKAGVLHRDFKPENVIVGSDGRARVADFGLAGIADIRGAPVTDDASIELRATSMTISVIGTPAYMAPEAHLSQPADARADQFAYSVALYEALYGRRPFAGVDYAELKANVTCGILAPTPAGVRVPGWLRPLLLRGLRVAPEERFPSMDALLDALARDPAARRRWLLAAAGVAVVSGVAVFAGMRIMAPPACSGDAEKLAGVWDTAVKERVRARFLASGHPYAGDTFDRVARALDGYAQAWVRMRTEACEATSVRHEQSQALLDLRMACLDRRAGALGALAQVLATEKDTVDKAVTAAGGLEPLATCADADALSQAYPPPADPAARVRLAALHQEIDRAYALTNTGHSAEAREQLLRLTAEARKLGYLPVLAEALHAFANNQIGLDRGATDAEPALTEAILAAAQSREPRLEAKAWSTLMRVKLFQGHAAQALELRVATESALARAGHSPDVEVLYLWAVGMALRADTKLTEARAALEAAISLAEKTFGANDWRVASFLNSLALVVRDQGKLAEAAKLFERARAGFESSMGADHPYVAGTLINIGNLYYRLGRYAETRATFEHALAIDEKNLGPDHLDVAEVIGNLASVDLHQRRFADAEARARRALATTEKKLGGEHVRLAGALGTLALAVDNLGRPAEARPLAERALTIREKAQGPQHPDVVPALLNLAHIDSNLARLDDADREVTRALAILDEKHVPDSRETLWAIAEIRLAQARPQDALTFLDRAAAVAGADPIDAAELDFLRARAMWYAPRDRVAAIGLARDAEQRLAAQGDAAKDLRAEIAAWLDHPSGDR